IIKGRKASDLVLIVTTSLYGHNSSQYNRLRYGKSLLFKPIGITSGYGSLHISVETFSAMRELAEANGCNTSNRFGMGPNWRMRVIRSACDVLNLKSDVILKHSFQRGLFAIPLAINCKSFLKGESKTPIYRNIPLNKLVDYWRSRWFNMRKQNDLVLQKVRGFSPEQFSIEKTSISNSE
ncbi:MAG TPA: Druantia anti-phage system protein DruA, partial [Candidatus Brocadiales bacterium]|nr:Druantia anti-phage system protein DruA [Candidatus Brocadiales bacterium]